MGIYYYLFNDTKKHEVHLDYNTKNGPMRLNDAVSFAFMNYMMDNLGDSMRILSDGRDYVYGYEKVDLLEYEFYDESVIKTIVDKLNTIYKRNEYKVINGIGIDTEDPDKPTCGQAQGTTPKEITGGNFRGKHRIRD